MGWNELREQIFANQKRLGVIPANAKLTDWPDSLPKWETLSADEKKLFARQAEVFAGYAAYTDHEIGRVIQQIEDMGKLDNTLIIYIVGDNGTSPEGTLVGTPNQWTAYNGILDFPIAEQLKFYDAWGSAATYPHMAVAWSWAFDTPFKWTKQIASHFEMIANRGIYNDGWYANTTPPHGPWILNAPLPPILEYKWELYNLTEDYSQANDLAAKMPGKLKEMQALFVKEAAKYNVLPMDNRSFARAVEPRPSTTAGKTVFTYTGVNSGIATANSPDIIGRSYTITAEVDVPQGGGNGVLATTGGRWGGWELYLLNGKPVFNYNMLILAQYRWEDPDALTPGKHTIVFDYTYDGPGIAKGGSGELKVDGKVVATGKQANSIAFLQVADETFDVGVDTRTAIRQGLSGAVRIQRQDRQADHQARADAADERRPSNHTTRSRASQRLGREASHLRASHEDARNVLAE
jgi:Sulfatase